MSAFPSLPLFTDAFIADTTHLGAAETGAYLLLLMVAWRRPTCDLPNDDADLSKWARVDRRTWNKIKPKVMAFWSLSNERWTQKRLLKEREIVSKRAEVARVNGATGGRPKRLKSHDTGNPTGSSGITQKKAPNPNPSKEGSEANASGAEAPVPVYTDSRHELWGEGKAILAQLGVKAPGPLIGRWLKDVADDALAVLAAIQRARDHRVIDPVPWITRALRNPDAAGQNRTSAPSGPRKVAQDTLVAGMAAALSERPDSRFGAGNAGGRRTGPADDPGDREELCSIAGELPLHRSAVR